MSVCELLWLLLCVAEVALSVVLHLSYGLLLLSSAIVSDVLAILSQSATESKVTPLPEDVPITTVSPPKDSAELAGNGRGDERNFDLPSNYSQFLRGHEEAPIVLVHGIFGFGKGKFGKLSYWGGAEKKDNRILVPDLGSLTSIHDRACDLFYFLKGGTVDYGVRHSKQYGHARYGKTYTDGSYPNWDAENPIHFVGHSTGAQVVRVLQQMLADKRFEGHDNTSADWVLSVTALSGALNGTTRVYIDGIRTEDGWSINTISLLQFLRLGVLLYEWLDIPLLKKYYSFGFDHYHLSWHHSGFLGFVRSILGQSGPFASGDWILPDLSIQRTIKLNRNLKTHPNTYYLSYATKRTRRFLGRTVPSTMFGIHPLLFLRTWQISRWHYPLQGMPLYRGYKDEEWHDNDGALNTISMLYPHLPDTHPNCSMGTESANGQLMKLGIWYYTILEADHIFFIINRQRAGIHFDVLYDSIFERCRKHLKRLPSQKLAFHCGCLDICICNTSKSGQTPEI